MTTTSRFCLAAALCLGCAPDGQKLPTAGDFDNEGTTPESQPLDSPYTPLSAGRLLRRAHLDLLGTLPSIDAVAAAGSGDAGLEAELDAIFEDPHLNNGLVDFFDRAWSLRLDAYDFTPSVISDEAAAAWAEQVGGEPLHIAARVAASDAPWSTVVTADWTVATPELAAVWPLTLDGDGVSDDRGQQWSRARYTDGRPAGGVLFTNGLRWRFVSGPNNGQRSRANALSRMFLCADYLDLPVQFDRSVLGEPGALVEATRTEPACLSCHETLDPIAAALFGLVAFESYDLTEQSQYHPEREPLGPADLDVDLEWFGEPYAGAVELGTVVAADPRFDRCAVQTVARTLWRRDIDASTDAAELERLQAVYEAEAKSLKPVLRAALGSPAWRAGSLDASAPDTEVARARLLTPRQLEGALSSATGYRWTTQATELLSTSVAGFRAVMGGGDPETLTPPADVPGVGHALVLDRVAWGAAWTAVQGDLAGDGPGLLVGVTADTRPGSAAFSEAVDQLKLRLHGETSGDGVAESDLWQVVFDETGEADTAWAAVVAGLLRDPAFWTL